MSLVGGVLAIGGAVGSSLIGASSRNKAARRAAKNQQAQLDAAHEAAQRAHQNQIYSTTYGNKLREFQADEFNKRQVKIYQTKIDQAKEQISWNNTEAGQAYVDTQYALNQQFQQSLLSKWNVLESLARAEGYSRATGTGSANRSKERANLVNTLRQDKSWLIDKSMESKRYAFNRNNLKIANKHYAADRTAYAAVSIPPELRIASLQAIPFRPPAPAAQLSIPSGGLGAGDFLAAGFTGMSAAAKYGQENNWFDAKQNIQTNQSFDPWSYEMPGGWGYPGDDQLGDWGLPPVDTTSDYPFPTGEDVPMTYPMFPEQGFQFGQTDYTNYKGGG